MKFWQVDSFTDKPFCGNPAAVVVLTEDIDTNLKQKIAMEMNLSETAFVLFKDDQLEIKWFTPNSEVDLCGHATLAAAHILYSEGFTKHEILKFKSKSGILSVSRKNTNQYTLDFPAQPATQRYDCRESIEKIISEEPLYLGSNDRDYLVVVNSDSYVRSAKLDLEKISQLDKLGFILSAPDSSLQYDFIYRAFFPKLNIPEDPVTGSANTLLAPYWSSVLKKTTLEASQVSSRGGELSLELKDQRVLISGKAVTVINGILKIM